MHGATHFEGRLARHQLREGTPLVELAEPGDHLVPIGVDKENTSGFFPKKITLFIHCRGLWGSSYQIRGTCYQLWISYLRSHFALAARASVQVDLHTFCAKTGSSSTSPLEVSASSVQFSSVAQSCPTLCDPMDCSLPFSSFHGVSQARILEWVAIPFSWGIFWTQGSNLSLLH